MEVKGCHNKKKQERLLRKEWGQGEMKSGFTISEQGHVEKGVDHLVWQPQPQWTDLGGERISVQHREELSTAGAIRDCSRSSA